MSDRWPPLPLPVTSRIEEWSRIYEGSVDESAPEQASARRLAGRLYWGQPQNAMTNPRPKMHAPLASDIAQAGADLLFGEPLAIDWDDAAVDERMDYVLDSGGFPATLLEAAELGNALGGVYLKVGWDHDVADHPLISALAADEVVPTFAYGRLVKATTWQVLDTTGGIVWRHLETHTPGLITHTLHSGTPDTLGGEVPLTYRPETMGLTPEVRTGIEGLAITYVPNVRPYAPWRRCRVGRNLGRSDFGVRGVKGFMDALDEAWTSWMRDLRLGKARLMVASSMLDNSGPGQGASVDLDREVYEGLTFAQPERADLSGMIQAQQFSIRVTEHAQTVEALLGTIIRSCGYSGSTFGLVDGTAAKTATEVDSVDRRSLQTRARKTRYWAPALNEFLTNVSGIDAAQFGAPAGAARVEFPATSQPNPLTLAQSIQAFRAAQAASIETAVRLAQPELTQTEVAEEVARIEAETKASQPAPTVIDPYGLAGVTDEDTTIEDDEDDAGSAR